jgi:hypothetical protein
MPRFCVLGPNCVGSKKQMAAAGYPIGVCANRDALFCSPACKQLDYNARKKEQRHKAKQASEKKIARLKKKGHTHCPGCKEAL